MFTLAGLATLLLARHNGRVLASRDRRLAEASVFVVAWPLFFVVLALEWHCGE